MRSMARPANPPRRRFGNTAATIRQRLLTEASLRSLLESVWVWLQIRTLPPAVVDRRRPVRHLVGVSIELANTRLGAAIENNRTILSNNDPIFVLYRLSERFGLPVMPEWADWFMGELKRRRGIRPLAGLGCSPVLITGTKTRFLNWISRGVRRDQSPAGQTDTAPDPARCAA